MQRLSVRYSGRVQGVGFRANVLDLARSFRVTGWVCNVADGTVELTAEGEEDELLRFQRAIRSRLDRNIVHCDESWSPATGEWGEFSIAADRVR
jgi:acylphosphatase